MKVALVVIAYNRLPGVERLLKSLSTADYSGRKVDLFISVDKSGTDLVEKFADGYEWPFGDKEVVKHTERLGLRKHILSQGKLLDRYDAIVVLEDDLVVSPCFYHYVEQAVEKYSSDERIAGISLYAFQMNYQRQIPFEPVKTEFDAFFMKCAMSWGQVWMKRQWEAFYKWYLDNLAYDYSPAVPSCLYTWPDSSWLKYHTRYCIEREKYFVYPYCSLSTDFSDVGTHNPDAGNTTVFQVPLQRGSKDLFLLPDLDGQSVRYDGFFENEGLYAALGLSPADCALDINGGNGNRVGKRYWLTTSKQKCRIVSSYGMNLRPVEMNVIESVPGEDIFLYDTQDGEPARSRGISRSLILFSYHLQSVFSLMRIYGPFRFFIDPAKTFLHKLGLKIKKLF